jgi:hypothetical protein
VKAPESKYNSTEAAAKPGPAARLGPQSSGAPGGAAPLIPVTCGLVPVQVRTVIKSERGGSRSDGRWADTVLGSPTQSQVQGPNPRDQL